MERIRIGNDIQVKFTVYRNGEAESFIDATGIQVIVRNEAYNEIIPNTYSISQNIVTINLDAINLTKCGKCRVILAYHKGSDFAVDSLAFELVEFSAGENGTVAIDAVISVAKDGKSAYEVWEAYPGNEGKTIEQYFEWLRENPTKVDTSRKIIAGLGLTGGGDLAADRTIDVISANDGITINADNIQLNTIDNVTSTSVTKPLSANQGKVLNEKVVQVETDLNYMYPSVGIAKRVLADAGTIKSRSTLNEITNKFLDLLPNTKLLFCPHLAVKLRESGIYKYVTKLYDIGPAMLDGAQTTALSQPYLSGNIAPNEKYAIKNPNGGNAYITHTPISFAATDKYSITFSYNNIWHEGIYAKIISSQGASHIRFQGISLFLFNSLSEYTEFPGMLKRIGKNSIFTLVSRGNGKIDLYVNGILNSTNTFNTEMSFSKLFESTLSSYGTMTYYCIRDIALTSNQVQDEYNYLRSLFPEIESVQIGTQTWATSNCEMTCTPQGNVIPEMQSATNVETIQDPSFNTGTGWNTNGIIDTTNGQCRLIANSTNKYAIHTPLQKYRVDRYYKIQYTISVNTLVGDGYLNLGGFSGGSIVGITTSNLVSTVGTHIRYFKGTPIGSQNAVDIWVSNINTSGEIIIEDVSVQEVGWSDSANLYNFIYDSTSGTAEQKEYAAVKAAAMWCHYNNDPSIGAVYGKLYNWYAVKLLQMDIDYYNAANPTATWGWRVPTGADFLQLSTYLGGESIAGGKLKKEGLDYWATPNAGATNESGFSGLPSGWRDVDGTSFFKYKTGLKCWSIDKDGMTLSNDVSSLYIAVFDPSTRGYSLRLIKA